jgi:outer membrane immunogenic protein
LGSIANTATIAGVPLTATSSVRNHVGRVGLNYRFGGHLGSIPEVTSIPAAYWNGPYGGVNAGYGNGRLSTVQTIGTLYDQLTSAPAGGLVGVQLGYSRQAFSHLVLGVEGDWQWTGQNDEWCRLCPPSPNTLTQFVKTELPWFATFRGRVGYAAGMALFYATGGAAIAEIKTKLHQQSPPKDQTSNFTNTEIGWVVGAGIETALGNNWTAKVEYLYLDLGSITHTVPQPGFGTVTLASDVRDQIARIGMNYKFDGGPRF